MTHLYLFILFLILLILILSFFLKNKIESFQTNNNNLFTYDSCCNQEDIQKCESYGKTGVCNYILNDNSCLCQNAN